MKKESHGHVIPRLDGVVARCGGPAICQDCNDELVDVNASLNKFAYCQFCQTQTPRVEDLILAHLLGCAAHPLNKKLRAAEFVIRTAESALSYETLGFGGGKSKLREAIEFYAPIGIMNDLQLFDLIVRMAETLHESKTLGPDRRGFLMFLEGSARALRAEEAEKAGLK